MELILHIFRAEFGTNFEHLWGKNWIKQCTLQRQKLDQIQYTFRGRNQIKFCTLLGLETGSKLVHFQRQKLDQFCTLLGLETGSKLVHFQRQKLDQILYTLRIRNWIKFCTLLGLETGPICVHPAIKIIFPVILAQFLYTYRKKYYNIIKSQ